MCIISEEVASENGIFEKHIHPTSVKVTTATGEPINVIGEADVTFIFENRVVKVTTLISDEIEGIILSWDTSRELRIVIYCDTLLDVLSKSRKRVSGIISFRDLGSDTRDSQHQVCGRKGKTDPEIPDDPTEEEILKIKADLIKEFADVFTSDDTPKLPPRQCPPMKIQLREGAEPFCLTASRQIPLAWREPTRKKLEKMEENGIISKIENPTKWCL